MTHYNGEYVVCFTFKTTVRIISALTYHASFTHIVFNRATHYKRRHVLVLNTKTCQNSKTLYFRLNFRLTYFNLILFNQIKFITNKEIKEGIIKACKNLKKQKNLKIVKTARKHRIYKDRVQRRFQRIVGPLYNKGGYNKHLTNNEDKALYLYINFAEDINLLIYEKTFIIIINLILRSYYKNSFPVS